MLLATMQHGDKRQNCPTARDSPRETDMSKTYRIKSPYTDHLEEMRINMIVETRTGISETDVLHALLWKYLSKITAKDVIKYKEWLEDPSAKDE